MEGKEARFGPLLVVFGFPSRGICCINHRRRRHHRQIFSFAFPFSLSFSSSSISSFPPHPAFLLFFFFYIFACPCFRLSFLYFFRMDSVSHLPSPISSNLSHIFCFSSPCYSPYIAPLSFPLPSLTSKLRQVSDMAFFLCLLSIALMYLFSLCNCLFII